MTRNIYIVFAVLVLMLFHMDVDAQGASKDMRVMVRGDFLTMEAVPCMENGNILVPMRDTFESLDAYLIWDNKSQSITAIKGQRTIKLKVGSRTAWVNGNDVPLNIPVKVIDGRTMVPLRFVAEVLDAQVEWDDADRIIKIKSDKEAIGNSSGNISNYGFAVQDGDYTYISAIGKGLYRVSKDGQEKEKILSYEVANINVIDGWIYFTYTEDHPSKDERGRLYKMAANGKSVTKLTDCRVQSVHIIGDWIYYINSEDSKLYKVRIDGKGKKSLYDKNPVGSFTVSDGWIYFKEQYDNALYKMRTNGSDKKFLCKGLGLDARIVAEGNWVYYDSYGNIDGISKVDIDGKEQQQIIFEVVDSFNVDNGYVYYNDSLNNLYKVRNDGSSKVKIGSRIDQDINIAGNWIYYKNWDSKDSDSKDYRIKLDSSLKQKLIINGQFIDLKVNYLSDKPTPNPITLPSHELKAGNLSAKEVAKQKDAVAYIKTFDENGNPIAYGSGFNIDSTGIIVTNFGILKGAASVKCTLANNLTFDVKYILNYNPVRDIAILQLGDASNLPTVKLGSSAKTELGEKVVAIGNPMDFHNTVSTGDISGFRNLLGINYIQTTAFIGLGSGGGPLFNMKGEVVGIMAFMLSGTQNINFAIPVDELKKLFPSSVLMPVQSMDELESSIFESEPDDSYDNASAARLEIDMEGLLRDKNDEDFYKVEINKPCKIIITGTTNVYDNRAKDISIILTGQDGNEICESQLQNELGQDYLNIKADVNKGIYYLIVKAADSLDDKVRNVYYKIRITEG